MINTTAETWRKSSRSTGPVEECVELSVTYPGRVRDSKDPGGAVLAFGPAALRGFLTAVREGHHDLA